MNTNVIRLVSALIIFSGSLAWSRSPPPDCMDPWSVAPPDGSEIPANSPGIALSAVLPSVDWIPSVGCIVRDAPLNPSIQLFRADGQSLRIEVKPASATVNTLWVRFLDPLSPGESYRLVFPELSRGTESDAGLKTFEASFKTTTVQPLPTTAGTFIVKSTTTKETEIFGVETVKRKMFWATLEFQPSPELQPFLPIASSQVIVGTRPLNWWLPGTLNSQKNEFSISLPCENFGKRQADFLVTLAGTETPLKASTEFELKCDESAPLTPAASTDSKTPAHPPESKEPVSCNSIPAHSLVSLLGLLAFAKRSKRKFMN